MTCDKESCTYISKGKSYQLNVKICKCRVRQAIAKRDKPTNQKSASQGKARDPNGIRDKESKGSTNPERWDGQNPYGLGVRRKEKDRGVIKRGTWSGKGGKSGSRRYGLQDRGPLELE